MCILRKMIVTDCVFDRKRLILVESHFFRSDSARGRVGVRDREMLLVCGWLNQMKSSIFGSVDLFSSLRSENSYTQSLFNVCISNKHPIQMEHCAVYVYEMFCWRTMQDFMVFRNIFGMF